MSAGCRGRGPHWGTVWGVIDRACGVLARACAVLGLGALLVFAATTILDAVLRFFFARPIDAVRDVGGLVAAFAVAACMPAVVWERGNIAIRFIEGLIGPRASRAADLFADALTLLVLGLMAWRFAVFAGQAARDSAATWMLRVPTAPAWWAVAGFLALAALLQARVAWLRLAGAPAGGAPEAHL